LEMICRNKDIYLGKNIKIAKTFWARFVGLMFSNDLNGFDGMLITPCNSIHTFFMNYNLDVVFMDNSFNIVKIIRNLKPQRITGIYWKATQVLELKAGTLSEKVAVGDKIECLS
jgi:uncharacterized protein